MGTGIGTTPLPISDPISEVHVNLIVACVMFNDTTARNRSILKFGLQEAYSRSCTLVGHGGATISHNATGAD